MDLDIKEPWQFLEDQLKGKLEEELRHELSSAHPLYNKKMTALARSYASDDVLFHESFTDQYYLVHLTWNRNHDVKFPLFKTFPGLENFIRYCMDTFQFHEE